MNKSQRAALFVFLSLLVTLVGGATLYFGYAGSFATAVPLLVGCVLAAFLMILAAARTTSRYRRSRMLADRHQVPPGKLLHALDLRQWLTLLVGITVVAITLGAFTGVRVLALSATTTPVPEPSFSLSPSPSPSPTPSETPTEPEPSSEPPSDLPSEPTDPPASDIPVPEATKYLDTEETTEGYRDPKPVTFAAKRFGRGIVFGCDDVTNSILQWNVAGMTSFSTTAGIDDATGNSFGKTVEFTFYDQDGRKLAKPVNVSVGHPKEVKLALTNVVSLRMTCATRDTKTNEERETTGALGDPTVATE
ncbi:NPCBM/NEW2 domain-containing protein [Actinoplanes sp. NPDC089786]|uniref:NPCBM/NEW2 domain-containing protein n=1 Tax=Actinoplanes sp. NPDC089786 TaxID=3155185 RepID=UPI00341C0BFA